MERADRLWTLFMSAPLMELMVFVLFPELLEEEGRWPIKSVTRAG